MHLLKPNAKSPLCTLFSIHLVQDLSYFVAPKNMANREQKCTLISSNLKLLTALLLLLVLLLLADDDLVKAAKIWVSDQVDVAIFIRWKSLASLEQ